ncbi:MAG: hypothetical protein HRT37_01710 [Alteromonadaceae bacterium]|nr:hypothetical protein [Alteromonadaceae bacterium]
MTKKHILLTIASACSLFLCSIAEFYFLDEPNGTFFARSGALIVILGTLINFFDFGTLDSKEYLSDEEYSNIQKHIENRNGEKAFQIHWKLEQDFRDNLIKFQGYVFILGTLIWGFGDLFFCTVLSYT